MILVESCLPFKSRNYNESHLVEEVAFLVIEQILIWLASLTEEDRADYTGALDSDENALIVALVRRFYLNKNSSERMKTETATLRLLNQAWQTKSVVWLQQRWEPISRIIASRAEGLAKKHGGDGVNIASPLEQLLSNFSRNDAASGKLILEKLVQMVRIFFFTGIVILIDKVDETDTTQNSAESTRKIVYPLLARIPLLEVEGFSWIFLWSKTKSYMEGDDYNVRLDKIAYTSIDLQIDFFKEILDERIRFSSKKRHVFADIFNKQINVSDTFRQIVELSMNSPRELIRLLDTLVREHDIRHSHEVAPRLLSDETIVVGLDKYAIERVSSVYNDRTLGQVYRLKNVCFTNKDVRRAFRTKDQAARNKIRVWEDAGVISRSGTRAAEG